MPDKEVPSFAGMQVIAAKQLARDMNNWFLWEHIAHGDNGPLPDDATIQRNCDHNKYPGSYRPTGDNLGVILDTDPPPGHGVLRHKAAAADKPVPDFAGMRVGDAVVLAYTLNGWPLSEHTTTGQHRYLTNYSARIRENCRDNPRGQYRPTGDDLGVVLDTRIEGRNLVRLLLSILGGMVGGATSLGLARALGFI